jgi:hypothetical protein
MHIKMWAYRMNSYLLYQGINRSFINVRTRFLLYIIIPMINIIYLKMLLKMITIMISIPHRVLSTSDGSSVPLSDYGRYAL